MEQSQAQATLAAGRKPNPREGEDFGSGLGLPHATPPT